MNGSGQNFTAAFTGAGLSGDAPASLPMGNWLRDDILRVMFRQARAAAPGLLNDEHLQSMTSSGHKLEMVLGRLWGVLGDDALGCLYALKVELPNTGHLLAALHLMRGGTHVTVNFDIGIELAHDLLSGQVELPARLRGLQPQLEQWQRLVPPAASPLLVVTSKNEFDTWSRAGQPPALRKVHGGLSRDQQRLLDVVVVDIEEIGALWPTRLEAVQTLADATRLVITGYGGADPDVYAPLLTAARKSTSEWRCPSLPAGSPVPADAAAHRITALVNWDDGTAVAAFASLLGIDDLPEWLPGDQHDVPRAYESAFAAWTVEVAAQHPAAKFVQAWAWMMADAGDLDLAATLLQSNSIHPDDVGARIRLAEVLYTRATPADLRESKRIFTALVTDRRIDPTTRDHCLLRTADLARKTLPGASLWAWFYRLTLMAAAPAVVLVRTRFGRRRTETAADAFGQVGHSALRLLELCAVRSPKWTWPALARLAGAASAASRRSRELAENGNRRAINRQRELTLQVLAAVLAGRVADPADVEALTSLRLAYRNAGDFPGGGNCSVSLALAAASASNWVGADALLVQGRGDHSEGQSSGEPLAGAAAVTRQVELIIGRLRRR